MNARNYLYIRKYNKPSAKRIADDKLQTKKLLLAHEIPTSNLLYAFETRDSIRNFSWRPPKEGFVVKPARGYGGEGIIVFESWEKGQGVTVSGQIYTLKQLESHLLDISEGVHSLQGLPDFAFAEEKITPHPFFRKYSPIGLPDIRVIVFNTVPVMAMLRLPNEESGGKANLHLGAVAAGIDLRTGITNHAIHKDKQINFLPGTKIKARGIKIPMWDEVLLLAARTAKASRLGYVGADLVFDSEKGPLVLEVNARPGLSIQNANLASLRSRLERIESLEIGSTERGVEVAKSLFAEDFSDKVQIKPKILGVIEPITLVHNQNERQLEAKLDTGAFRTSLDEDLARELEIPIMPKKIFVQSASGQSYRPAVKITFLLAGKRITTTATIADRSHMNYPIIIGRRDLKGFYVDPMSDGNDEKTEEIAVASDLI